jgi:hypothetical protein
LLAFWTKLKYRVKLTHHLATLASSISAIFLKRSFRHLTKSSSLINQKIAVMRDNGNRKIINRLFQLLVKNLAFNLELSEEVNGYHVGVLQRKFIKMLNEGYLMKL